MPVYGTFDQKSSVEGILKAQQNQEGDTDTVTVYLFLQKYDVAFQNCQTKVYRGFYGTLNENKPLTAQQNQEGDTSIPFTVTVYLFLAKHTISLSYRLGFRGRTSFLVEAKKPGATHIHYVNKFTHVLHHIHDQVTQSTRDGRKQRAATKARSHQTNERRLGRS